MSLALPSEFNDALESFNSRKDPRRLSSAFKKVNSTKTSTHQDSWWCLAAGLIVALMGNKNSEQLITDLGLTETATLKAIIKWGKKKNSDRDLLALALETIERLPRKHKFENQHAIAVGNLYQALLKVSRQDDQDNCPTTEIKHISLVKHNSETIQETSETSSCEKSLAPPRSDPIVSNNKVATDQQSFAQQVTPINCHDELHPDSGSLSITSKDLPFSLLKIIHLKDLEQLHLSGSFEKKETLSYLKTLHTLTITNSNFSPEDFDKLPNTLKHLAINLNSPLPSSALSRLVNLNKLTISNTTLKGGLAFLYDLPNLKEVTLCNLPDISNLAEIFTLDQMEKLTLAFMNDLSDVSAIANLPNLTYLSISGLPKLKEIPSLKRLVNLKELHLELLGHVKDFSPAAEAPYLEEVTIGFANENAQTDSFLKFRQICTLKTFTLRNTFHESLAYDVNRMIGETL
jgi:hypothetical protein